jgi:hypothetical protein
VDNTDFISSHAGLAWPIAETSLCAIALTACTPPLTGDENGGGKGRCVGERERGKRRREKERGGRFPD